MKRSLQVILWGVIVGADLLRAEPDPTALTGYPIDRYQTILTKSPFARETPVEENAAGPLFGQDLILTGHYKLGEALYAVILNKKTHERFTASSTESRVDHPRVVTLTIDPDPAKSTALIQLGVEKATLKFDIANVPKESQKGGSTPTPPPAPAPAATNKATTTENSEQKPLSRVRYKVDKTKGEAK